MSDQPTLYNHMFDVAFTVISPESDPDKISKEQLIEAARERLRQIENSDEPIDQVFGSYKSYDIQPDEPSYEENHSRYVGQVHAGPARRIIVNRLRGLVLPELQRAVERLEQE